MKVDNELKDSRVRVVVYLSKEEPRAFPRLLLLSAYESSMVKTFGRKISQGMATIAAASFPIARRSVGPWRFGTDGTLTVWLSH